MKKRILAVILSIVLGVTGSVPMAVYASQTEQDRLMNETEDENEEQEEIENDLEAVPETIPTVTSEAELEVTPEPTEPETVSERSDSDFTEETAELVSELSSVMSLARRSTAVAVEAGSYEISSAMSEGQMLTIESGSVSSGARTVLWNKSEPYNQKIQLIDNGDGWYVIRFPHSGLVLDIYGSSCMNGATVQQYKQNGTDAQLWRFEDAGDGYVYIRSKLGTYLDCAAGQSTNGTIVQTYVLNETIAQKWKISSVENWITVDGRLALYNGSEPLTGWQMIAGIQRYLDEYGVIVDGFKEIEGEKYYFDQGRMLTGWQTIDGDDYYFDNTGAMQSGCEVDGTMLGEDGKAVYEERTVETGIYMFSIFNQGNVLSVCSGAREDGVSMELDMYGYKVTQQYEVEEVEDGWYSITNVRSGKALSVRGDSKESWAGVEQRSYTNKDSQLWQFIESGDGYVYVRSKLGTVLDCPAGSMKAGTVLHMYQLNRTNAQKWDMKLAEEPELLEVEDGIYQLTGYGTGGKILAVSGYGIENQTSITLNALFGHPGEQYKITSLKNGWYSIINMNSGKALDVAAANAANWAAVQQYTYNGTDAQQWRFIDAGGGYCYIQSKVGTVLDRPAGSTAEGTVIHMYSMNQTSAQKWKIEDVQEPKTIAVQDGAEYLIASAMDVNQVLDVSGSSGSNWANIQLWQESVKMSQKFRAVLVKDGWYKLVSVNSGKVLDVYAGSKNNGANVQQYEWNGSDAQLWRFIDAGNGYCYIQSKLGSVLDCTAGQYVNGTNIQTYTPNKTQAQRFKLYNTSETNYVHVTKLTDYTSRVTLYSPSGNDVKTVEFPSWSSVNGQDDVKWLQGTKNVDGSWSVVVDSKDFDADGTFKMITHVYINTTGGNVVFAGQTSYNIKAHLEGWIYVNGYRRYRNDNGTLRDDVSDIFNPSSKYITVDCKRGITTIYGYNSATGSYDTPIKAFWCSVGRTGEKQTPSGTYRIYRKYQSKIMNASDGSYSVWAPYISCFNGSIYFHGVASVGQTPNQIAQSSWLGLGTPRSSGCVRLAGIEAKWIYENCAIGTSVMVSGYNQDIACPITNPIKYPWTGGAIGPDPSL